MSMECAPAKATCGGQALERRIEYNKPISRFSLCRRRIARNFPSCSSVVPSPAMNSAPKSLKAGIRPTSVPAARAETGAGGIVAKFVSGTDRTDSVLETSAGDITVYLAPTLNITIRASIELANGHRIRSDFSEIRVTTEGGEWGPGTATAEGNLNGGGPTLKVRTTTGDITFLASR